MTTRGMKETDCQQVAELIDATLMSKEDKSQLDRIRFQVNGMMRTRPLFGW